MSQLNKSQRQKTIKNQFCLEGLGIHTGKTSKITVKPAPANTGIVFLKSGEKIKAVVENVVATKLGTSLKGIKTVEHLLAAVMGLGIDNLEVEIEGEELPILDGSALPYAQKLIEAEIVIQNSPKHSFEINEPLTIVEKDKSIKISPYYGFKINFMVDYPTIGRQEKVFEGKEIEFLQEIAPARTFGFVEEVEELREKGFSRGASLENALAISRDGYLNQPRFPDEPVRHKILDLLGDLTLLGCWINGEVTAIKSNHQMNIQLVKLIRQRFF